MDFNTWAGSPSNPFGNIFAGMPQSNPFKGMSLDPYGAYTHPSPPAPPIQMRDVEVASAKAVAGTDKMTARDAMVLEADYLRRRGHSASEIATMLKDADKRFAEYQRQRAPSKLPGSYYERPPEEATTPVKPEEPLVEWPFAEWGVVTGQSHPDVED